MAKLTDGGPAFPQLSVTACERDGHGDLVEPFTSVAGGMTLRDWFAGQALMVAMIAANDEQPFNKPKQPMNVNAGVSKAYEIADAMLAQRAALSDEAK